jgi:hypothetical protein
MKKIMLGVSMLLVSTCIIAQEPAKSKRPMVTPTKQASSPTQETGKSRSESKSTTPEAKDGRKNQANRDVEKSKDPKEKNIKTPKGVTQRDRPKDIPN